MKTIQDYINKTYVSLNGIDEAYKQLLNNLQGKQINECCCCGCDAKCCEPTCCDCDNSFIFFYSENEIINKLQTDPKVQDIFNIHHQFDNRFRFMQDNDCIKMVDEPLYFKNFIVQNSCSQDVPVNKAGLLQASKAINSNENLYNFIQSIRKTFNCTYPIVLGTGDNEIQVFIIKGCGSNGQEYSIKNSLIEVAKMLDRLDKMEHTTWSQVLDVSIDNLDDVYNFLVTFTININEI